MNRLLSIGKISSTLVIVFCALPAPSLSFQHETGGHPAYVSPPAPRGTGLRILYSPARRTAPARGSGLSPAVLPVTRNGNPGVLFQEEEKGGGFAPGLKSLFFGPRVGLEANEGKPVSFIEKANLFVPIAPFQAYSVSGIKGFAASAFLGPRIGMELPERRIRKKEWFGLLPVIAVAYHLSTSQPSSSTVIIEAAAAAFFSRLWTAFEAYRGRTMTDIERAENLER